MHSFGVRRLLQQLWSMFQKTIGAPDDQIVIGIQEVSSSQADGEGQIMSIVQTWPLFP
jgi:hypothetical protein